MGLTGAPRMLAILITDIVGSTAELDRLGDEQGDAERRKHFATLRSCADPHRGEEVKNTGDGLVIVFPSIVDAVECAIEMQQVMEHDRRREDGEGMRIRIGLHVGEPVPEKNDLFGLPVVLATRLCAAAEPDGILASDVVRAVAQSKHSLSFVPVGPVHLKGIAEPVVAWRVEWVPEEAAGLPLPATLEAATRTRAPFVERADELAHFKRCWERALDGERQLAFVSGEPGIGKTRLVAEFAASIHLVGGAVLWGRTWEEGLVAYQPMQEALRSFLEICPSSRAARFLDPVRRDLAPLLPEFDSGSASGGAEPDRFRLFSAVANLLDALSVESPVLFVLDDLHWADEGTLLMASFLMRRQGPARLMLVGMYREWEIVRGHPLVSLLADIRRERPFERIRLHGLTPVGVGQLMGGTGGTEPPPSLAQSVWDETNGNPFFVEEVAAHLLEMHGGDDGSEPWSSIGLDDLQLPEGVRDFIGQRLGRLSPDANTVLAIGAVEGRQFRVSIVQRVAEMPLDHVVDVLHESVRAGLLIEASEFAGLYSFSHALVRDTLTTELGPTRVAHLHMRVARAIEGVYAHNLSPHAAELAHHYLGAVDLVDADKALEYSDQAGRQAMADIAYEQAISHFERALAIVEDHLDTGQFTKARRCEMLLELGDAHNHAGHGDIGRQVYAAAGRLAEELHLPELLAQAALGYGQVIGKGLGFEMGVYEDAQVELLRSALLRLDTPSAMRSRLLARLALARVNAPEDSDSGELSEQAVDMARQVGELPALANALISRHGVVWASAPPDTRLALADEVLAMSPEDVPPHVSLLARVWQCTDLLEMGERESFEEAVHAFGALLHELRLPEFAWYEPMFASTLAMLDGDLAKAEARIGDTFEHAKRFGDPHARQSGAAQILALWIEQSRHAELVEVLTRFVQDYPGNPTWRCPLVSSLARAGELERARAELDYLSADNFALVPRTSVWLAGMAGLTTGVRILGAHDVARFVYDALQPHAGRVVVIGQGIACLGAVDHSLGVLAAVLGDLSGAHRHLSAAAKAHRALGSPLWQARTALEQARLFAAAGDARHALESLTEMRRMTIGIVLPDIADDASGIEQITTRNS